MYKYYIVAASIIASIFNASTSIVRALDVGAAVRTGRLDWTASLRIIVLIILVRRRRRRCCHRRSRRQWMMDSMTSNIMRTEIVIVNCVCVCRLETGGKGKYKCDVR